MSPLTVLLVVGALLHCGLTAPTVRASYTELFSSFDIKQRIAYRIGQVECLKTLLSEDEHSNAQFGLGALNGDNYNTDITRFSLRQRIAFLHGQVQCLRIHLSLEGNMTSPLNNNNQEPVVYLDCKDAYQKGRNTSGLYTINPDNQTAFQVYCDMDTSGGGWTVIQRRFDGSVSFDRNWTKCETGFGNKTGEYWLGLSYVRRLTTSAGQQLRVDLEDFASKTSFAQYTTFTVANAADKYRLQVSGYSGTAGDAMYYNSGKQFTTRDSDNDSRSGNSENNCASYYKGPWWHKNCSFTNLNARYYKNGHNVTERGVTWYQWKDSWYSMKKASMKIRRG